MLNEASGMLKEGETEICANAQSDKILSIVGVVLTSTFSVTQKNIPYNLKQMVRASDKVDAPANLFDQFLDSTTKLCKQLREWCPFKQLLK